ncbi:hypothetical protein DOY81_011529 [Sarcophaga bullata]|nr:hypothetical protein DOY81_011529 [Sarcophaga bullata]
MNPTKLFDSPQCGNGFVEPGEQCDCGLPNYCENTCCDPFTCMLHTNASCATGECCDLNTCRPKLAGTQCRNAENECDLPEYCTGESEYCPRDVFKRDTEECDNGQAYCYQGNCRSHSYQCRILWGPTGENSEPCYAEMNVQGKREENALCGMLHCRHLNEKLEFGMETAAVLSHSFITYDNNIVPCRSALVVVCSLWIRASRLMGQKCGDNKMCVDQKCWPLNRCVTGWYSKIRSENCNGNGICNSKGNCHCNIGFTGATCKLPGPGGSVDSGPATNPNSHEAFQRFMYIFFFAVLPIMAAFCFFMYYCRHHPFFVGGKLAENMYVSNTKHGLSFSTSSYTTVTPNICNDLNSPSSPSSSHTTPFSSISPCTSTSSSTTTTFKSNSSLTPKTSVKLIKSKSPSTTTATTTTTTISNKQTTPSTKTPAITIINNTTTKTITPSSLNIQKNMNTTAKTTISCTTTPKLTIRKSKSNLMHSSASNENFSKFPIQKHTNIKISKSHNEIATTITTTTTTPTTTATTTSTLTKTKPKTQTKTHTYDQTLIANIAKPHIKTKIACVKPPPPPPIITTTTTTTNSTTITPPPPPPPKGNLYKNNEKFSKSSEQLATVTATKINNITNSNNNNNNKHNNNNNNNNLKSQNQNTNKNADKNMLTNSNSNASNVNSLRRKFEITDVRLNSTKSHALVDGTTYTINDETNRCVYHCVTFNIGTTKFDNQNQNKQTMLTNSNSNASNVNSLRRKFEITDVRLNSTKSHALVDGTTYTINDETNRCVYHCVTFNIGTTKFDNQNQNKQT